VVHEIGIRAYMALILWVPVSAALFASLRPTLAAVIVFVGGIVLLPEVAAFDLPALPPMDKNAIATTCAFVGAMLFARRRMRAARPLRGVDVFFLVAVAGNVGTALTNPDPVVIGGGLDWDGRTRTPEIMLPPIGAYDIVSMTARDFIAIFMPFYLGRALVRTGEDARMMLRVLAVVGLLHLPLMLLEMRFSPQLHNWLYGYHATSFAHAMRSGGFKPTAFMAGGLAMAMLIYIAMMSAAALGRVRARVASLPGGAAAGILWALLVFSRNVGANIYALATAPVVLLTRGRTGVRLALVLAALVVAFPLLRATGRFPTDEMVTIATRYSVERGQSLQFRFDNEDDLLERAQEKMWFGWGGFGRNRVYDERGKDISTTDGEWIIRMGTRGYVGFVGSFGLLLAPIFLARRRVRRLADPLDARLLDALALIVAVSAVDLLPNGLFNVLPFFLAGALAGLAQGSPVAPPGRRPAPLAAATVTT
jgi:hypothetical protein